MDWNFFDHIKCSKENYSTSYSCIGSCSDIIEFWNCYEKIPKPSEFFYIKSNGTFYQKPYYKKKINSTQPDNNDQDQNSTGSETVDRYVSAIGMFKESHEPLMEKNPGIKIISYVLNSEEDHTKLDDYWYHLCLKCISGLYNIIGFRCIDSSLGAEQKVFYKVELWVEPNLLSEIETKFRSDFKIKGRLKIV
jgi:hypothetical protein